MIVSPAMQWRGMVCILVVFSALPGSSSGSSDVQLTCDEAIDTLAQLEDAPAKLENLDIARETLLEPCDIDLFDDPRIRALRSINMNDARLTSASASSTADFLTTSWGDALESHDQDKTVNDRAEQSLAPTDVSSTSLPKLACGDSPALGGIELSLTIGEDEADIPFSEGQVNGHLLSDEGIADAYPMPGSIFGMKAFRPTIASTLPTNQLRVTSLLVPMGGSGFVNCGELTAEACVKGICLEAGAAFPCNGGGSGTLLGQYFENPPVDISAEMQMSSIAPCSVSQKVNVPDVGEDPEMDEICPDDFNLHRDFETYCIDPV